MKESIMTLKSVLAAALAGVLMASCTAHGQQAPRPVLPELSGLPYWKAFRNHSSHNADFFRSLLFGRVYLSERLYSPGLVNGELVLEDGRVSWCYAYRNPKVRTHRHWEGELRLETHSTGVARTLVDGGNTYRYLIFYEPQAGALSVEGLAVHVDPQKRMRRKDGSGWIQDSWPRVLADACPGIELPAGMEINEKQTSRNLDELRRQDRDAVLRNFPGSQHTGPGRTGLAASGGKPTTTREEVEAFMKAHEGNILLSSLGNGYVFTEGWTEATEIWPIGYDGGIYGFGKVTRKTDASGQEWTISEIPGVGTVHYPIGYPLPLLSTGHRHAAWQITDWLIESGRVLEVPELGEGWKGVRFHAGNRAEAFPAAGGAPETGGWRWTKGQLQVWLGDGSSALEHWQDLSKRLNMGVKIWTPLTPNTGT